MPDRADAGGVAATRVDAWELAGAVSSEWMRLSQDCSEVHVLMHYARRLLQAILHEEQLLLIGCADPIAECRRYLETELESPGEVIRRLGSSTDPKILNVADEVSKYGKPWVTVEGIAKNTIVLTALLNLPGRD